MWHLRMDHGCRIYHPETGSEGCCFAIALRNSHHNPFHVNSTVGVRVFVWEMFQWARRVFDNI